ncbi:MAG: HAMP domain-containing histidine kinase [Lachnospiraceae bacterium]|nr:HAMP domain-containing histidine kinase [Lachnospiraceae bacterium]
MKTSIRHKLTVAITLVMGIVTLLGTVLGKTVIEDYYLQHKQNSLISVYNELCSILKEDPSLQVYSELLDNYCEKYGVSLQVQEGYESLYNYGSEKEMREYITDDIIGRISGENTVLQQNRNYTIMMVPDSEQAIENLKSKIEKELQEDGEVVNNTSKKETRNATHLVMSGTISDVYRFVIRVDVENIRESIVIASKFYTLVGILMICAVLLAMYFITNRYTRPILELADISKKMASLNFDVKYDEKREDEIGVLGKNMNEMSEELEKAIRELKYANMELQNDIKKKNEIDKMRTDFLDNVSHELKTPIALIQGYAEGLKDGITDDPDSMAFYCDVIIDEASKMNKMVKNLLTLNQIEFGDTPYNVDRFNLTELVKDVVNAQRLRAEQTGVNIEIIGSEDVFVWADEFQIEEVITNYISNAFNHIKDPNIIRVQIAPKDDIVRVSVFNTGAQIPKEDLDFIWEKFYKVDKAHTREYGGNGIGLSIVKAIIDKYDGNCGVDNKADGVEFWFELDTKSK